MNKISKICIVIPYFGEWPEWMNYFLLSCKYNPSINWQFFTDCGLPDVASENLTFHQMTLADFNKLASTQLGIELNIQHPYKLCDLKPAYGLIFQAYLENYDFWGYGDIDLIYGNISSFITNDILDKYDIISNHREFIAGHFCLLRNSKKINKLFMRGGYYSKAFTESKYIGFDEQILNLKIFTNPRYNRMSKKININSHLLLNYIINSPVKTLIKTVWGEKKKNKKQDLKDFTSIVSDSLTKKEIRVRYKTTSQSDLMLIKRKITNWNIIWDKGMLRNSQTDMELLYFHFILSKSSRKFIIDTFYKKIHAFHIQSIGIKVTK